MDGTQAWQDPETGERFISDGKRTIRESRMDPDQFEELWAAHAPEEQDDGGGGWGTAAAVLGGLAALTPTGRGLIGKGASKVAGMAAPAVEAARGFGGKMAGMAGDVADFGAEAGDVARNWGTVGKDIAFAGGDALEKGMRTGATSIRDALTDNPFTRGYAVARSPWNQAAVDANAATFGKGGAAGVAEAQAEAAATRKAARAAASRVKQAKRLAERRAEQARGSK